MSHDPASVTDAVVKRTPWWAISIGLHTLAALALAFVFVVGSPAETVVMTEVRRREPVVNRVEFHDPLVRTTPFKTDRAVEDPQLTTETDPVNDERASPPAPS